MSAGADREYDEVSKDYRAEQDFAFFAANFGYSKSDYDELTPREKAFMYKAWENRIVSGTTFIYNAVFTAVYNANRPKRKRPLKLWKKPKVRRADSEAAAENLAVIRESEKNEGNGWIKKVYEANGMKYRGGGVGG